MAKVAELEKYFKRLIKSEKLSHGYLLYGHTGIGERVNAVNYLANFLENDKWEKAEQILFDYKFIDANIAGGIDLVRESTQFLWQKPIKSVRRTLIIDNADQLTPQAQGAILKIGEEPPAHALIFLLLKSPDAILPAVVSRFQRIFISGEIPEAKANAKGGQVSADDFLMSDLKGKKDFLRDLADREKEGEALIDDFVFAVMRDLAKDPVKNFEVLRRLTYRWALINQFNVNKRLQLEAALL
ncbi:MAG: DNA polymerase III subunit delta' [Parcubacteria group bacterium Gr01-1014_3]|nr:MAG: DNA polymerase III subunit delta' [Parcubacteria group bacterium Gr01-1014_3]